MYNKYKIIHTKSQTINGCKNIYNYMYKICTNTESKSQYVHTSTCKITDESSRAFAMDSYGIPKPNSDII